MRSGRLRSMRREEPRPATVTGARDRAERLWNEAVAHPCAPAADDANGSNAPLLSPALSSPRGGEGEEDGTVRSPSAHLGDERAAAREPDGTRATGQQEEEASNGPPLPSGPATGKLRALWNSAYDLGLIHDRSDAALGAWLCRLAHLDGDAGTAPAGLDRPIQALKAWLARAAGVDWRPHLSFGQDGRVRERHRPRARVLEAQWRLLHRRRRLRIGSEAALGAYAARYAGLGRADSHLALSNAQADALIRHLGKCIRRASERHD